MGRWTYRDVQASAQSQQRHIAWKTPPRINTENGDGKHTVSGGIASLRGTQMS